MSVMKHHDTEALLLPIPNHPVDAEGTVMARGTAMERKRYRGKSLRESSKRILATLRNR